MKEKYLPIGTVVLLKEASKRLMITGYCSSQPSAPDVVYDYVACLFPEGNLAGDDVALFNHDQIGTISHMGLEDDEYKEVDKHIKEAIAGVNNVFAANAQNAESAPQQNTPNLDHIDFNNLAPFTPENINTMLNEIHKHGDEFKPITEPTAFDEEVIKKPAFELPSLGGDDEDKKKEEEKKKEVEDEEEDFEEEEEVVEEVKESVADGQPVLQLQPIFDNTSTTTESTPSEPAAPVAPVGGGFSGLSRL